MSIKNSLPKLKQADLMALFSVTDRTIQRWHDQGLPRHGEGRGCYYVWADVLPWYLAFMSGKRGDDETQMHRERKIKADADIAVMDAEKQAGELMRVSEAKTAWGAFLSRLNASLDGFPDRAAEQLEDGMILAERVAALRREMNILRRDVVAEQERVSA